MSKLSEEPVDLSLHPAGMNNVARENALPEGTLRSIVNFDVNSSGKKRLRPGYSKVYSGTNTHSLSPSSVSLGKYFVEGIYLKELRDDYTAATLTTVSADKRRRMYYVQVGDVVYYSNGTDSGSIKDGVAMSWGVDTPSRAPSLSEGSGILKEGTYAVKLVAVRDGELSGSTDLVYIDVGDESSIVVSDIPTQASADYIRIYVTQADGHVFYKAADVVPGLASYAITTTTDEVLETDNLYNSPVGRCLCPYRGRVYLAQNNIMVWTEAIHTGLYSFDNFIMFPSRVKIIAAVDDGLFVVADKTYFLKGTSPSEFTQTVVTRDSGIEGTAHKLSSNYFNQELYNGPGVYWASDNGLVRGQNGGTVIPLTEKKLSTPDAESGATGFVEMDGLRKIITAMSKQEGTNNLVAGDIVTATITRANEVT